MKYDNKFIVYAYFFFFCTATTGDIAAKGPAFCETITKTSSAQAILINNDNRVANTFELGELSSKNSNDDFIYSKNSFRIILRPKNLSVDEDCSMSICTKKEKVASECDDTSEYILKIGIAPAKFDGGAFKSDFNLNIIDKNLNEVNAKTNFKNEISGILLGNNK